jgi:hypothetical protein
VHRRWISETEKSLADNPKGVERSIIVGISCCNTRQANTADVAKRQKTGREIFANGCGGFNAPKHGRKTENFPAGAPATTTWKLSGAFMVAMESMGCDGRLDV